jgi:hypothetical protein
MVTKRPKKPASGGTRHAASSPGVVQARGAAWTFPKNTLEDAVRIARAIEDKNAGRPMRADLVARAVGYNRARDWRFRDLLRSANQYGVVQGAGATAVVSITKLGEDVVAPSSSTQRQEALVEAFRTVELFKKVEEFYSGKKIPEDEFFENTLVREFQIPRDRIRVFINVFTENLQYLNLFSPRKVVLADAEPGGAVEPRIAEAVLSADAPGASTRIREFLDSCFVMMPFGGWFDRYYQEVYVPAIKAAGFEPVRSDELFTTGSVVEQIWDQVGKSTVLFADLSDKNANVFYELGLAHAARKPVVLAAKNIDDVPFDLRHLRVIVYDVHEPRWSEKLGKNITDYLKNAKTEPEKSIPQPFRDLLARFEEGDFEDAVDDDDQPERPATRGSR